MQIKNVKVYGLNESIIRSGFPMKFGEPETFNDNNVSEKDSNRAIKLSNTEIGTGHSNFLKGIIVQFDLKYAQYWTPQLQRYHFFEIVSSQSKMHCLTKINDISKYCNNYVLTDVIQIINDLIRMYNKEQFPCTFVLGNDSITISSKEDCFKYIISNLPMGYEMWMAITTNYLQLKTIYKQRKSHKLKDDWGEFCKWIETLPNSELIINNKI